MIRSGGEVARLITQLRDADPIRRDAAVAKLRIVGPRAIDALTEIARSTHPIETRCGALKALEGMDDPRAVEAALPLLTDPDARLAAAALGALRHWVTHESGTRVLEALTATALNPSTDGALRLGALDAIAQLPRHVVAPLIDQAAVGASASGPDDPLSVLDWLAGHHGAPLSEIHQLIVRVRDWEQQDPAGPRRDQWRRARGAAHAVLAARRSTVAVYDLRESFETVTEPLPADFLTAVAQVGDASCLEPMARAWTATKGEGWWRSRLVESAADIMRREKLTGRSALVKRLRAKWPGFI